MSASLLPRPSAATVTSTLRHGARALSRRRQQGAAAAIAPQQQQQSQQQSRCLSSQPQPVFISAVRTPAAAAGTSTRSSRPMAGLRPIAVYGKSLRTGGITPRRGEPSADGRAHFSTSRSRHATVIKQNVRQDEDGNDMLIDITPRAQKRLREIANKDKNPELALRVAVQSGGCHGFQYLMSLTSTREVSGDEDTVFETEEGDARVVMDEPSLALLKGSKVDFTMELIGSQFKITGNPAASSSCGCGTSFDIKV